VRKARRHIERVQDETFVPVRGTLTMYLGEPPTRHEISVGGLVHVEAGTAQQMVNETDDEVLSSSSTERPPSARART
jgi:mannose-6-phosphate isomerase-like protein (cupin superfamily)